MYPSIRDDMLTVFSSPMEGLQHLGLSAVELEINRDLEMYTLHAFERISLREPGARKEYRKALNGAGVRASCLLTMCDFSGATPEANVAWMAQVVEVAAELGAESVRVDTAMHAEADLPFGERVAVFVRDLGGVLARTAGYPVSLGMENHGQQGNNLAFLLNIIHDIGSDRIGMTLDTGNFYWRGYPRSEVYGILKVLAPHTRHTHLKNIRYPETIRETVRESGYEYMRYVSSLEEGDIDHHHVVSLLRNAGYQGDLCIENESLSNHDRREDRVAILERDAAHVKSLVAAG